MEKGNKAELGCLLIHNLTSRAYQMELVCQSIEEAGYPAEVADLFADPNANEPPWLNWLTQAQEAYLELRRKCDSVVVLGVGYGSPVATVLAEQYPVGGLIVAGCVMRMRNPLEKVKWLLPTTMLPDAEVPVATNQIMKLLRLAENNLFSVVADVLVLQPDSDSRIHSRSVKALLRKVCSPNTESIGLPGTDLLQIIRFSQDIIVEAVLNFLARVASR